MAYLFFTFIWCPSQFGCFRDPIRVHCRAVGTGERHLDGTRKSSRYYLRLPTRLKLIRTAERARLV